MGLSGEHGKPISKRAGSSLSLPECSIPAIMGPAGLNLQVLIVISIGLSLHDTYRAIVATHRHVAGRQVLRGLLSPTRRAFLLEMVPLVPLEAADGGVALPTLRADDC